MSVLTRSALASEALRANFARPPFPFKLTFAVTYNCNSRCKTCAIWKRESKGELSLKEIEALAKRNNKFRWIGITGGEPFLREDLPEIVGAFARNCPLDTLTITTNSLLPEQVVSGMKKIVALGIPNLVLTLSCDGPEKVHDFVRGVPGNFSKICWIYEQLKGLQGRNFKIFFGFTQSSLNIGSFEPLYRDLHRRFPEIGYERIHVNVFHSSSHFYGTSAQLAQQAKSKIRKEVSRIGKKRKFHPLDPLGFLEKSYLGGVGTYLETGKSPLPCAAASASLFLDPYGNLYPCTIWNRKLGNIRKGKNIESLWESAKFRETARLAKELKCPQCWTPCEAYQTIAANVLFRRIS